MKNKLILIISIIFVLFIVVGFSIYFNKEKILDHERIKILNKMGNKYYEEYYYDTVGIDTIKNLEEKGIIVDLDTLYNSKLFSSNKKLKKCDKEKTLIKIIPSKPFNKKSKTVEVVLSCK